ncbi:MAG: sugar ABC transporter substrate-binding protein [Alcaligenaceae bacterium]|nr:MAG: sugar ABC transporter substrate-binding protein [Alcaligenaceae bacterium]
MPTRVPKSIAVASLGALLLGLVVACTTPSDTEGSGQGDDSARAPARSVDELNVGFFMTTTANPYASTFANSVKSEAKAAGVKLTEIDSGLDVQTQNNQMQQAVSRKTYNAWIVVAANGEQQCNQIKSAIKSGIEVMVTNGQVCNGEDVGQVGYTGWQVPDNESMWFKEILGQNSDAKIALLAGPSTIGVVQSMKTSMESALEEHPQAELVSYMNTDWSIPDGLAKTRELLRTNPDTEVIVSSYSNVTRGVVQALKESGRLGDIKIYDWAGDSWGVDQIREGVITMTLPGLPVSEAVWSVRNLVAFWTGKEYEKFDSLFGHSPVPNGPFITRDNAAEYTAEYTT